MWQSLIRTFAKKDFMTLFLGTGISQLVRLLGLLVLARIYSPEHFGELGLFISVVGLVSMFSAGGYAQTVMLPKESQDAYRLHNLSLFFTLLISLFVAGACLLIGFVFDFEKKKTFLTLLPFATLFFGITHPSKVLSSRFQRYKTISYAGITFNFVMLLVAVSLGCCGQKEDGLLYGITAGYLAFALVYIFDFYKKIERPQLKRDYSLLKRYTVFFKFGLLSDTVNSLARELPFLMIPYFFGEIILGHFVMAMRFLMLPYNLISQNLGSIFYEKGSKITTSLKKITLDTLIASAGLGLLIYLLIFLVAPWLVPLALGNGWGRTILFVQILSIWLYLRFAIVPVSYLFDLYENQKRELHFNIIKCLLTFLALSIGGFLLEIEHTLLLFTFGNLLFFFIYLRYLLHLSSKNRKLI